MAAAAPAAPAVLDTPEGRLSLDYDVLARSLLRELAPGAAAPGVVDEMRAENRRIAQERDDYARRLELACAKLDEFRAASPQQGTESGPRR